MEENKKEIRLIRTESKIEFGNEFIDVQVYIYSGHNHMHKNTYNTYSTMYICALRFIIRFNSTSHLVSPRFANKF